MNILTNVLKITFRSRIIIFIFLILLCLDVLILFFYPRYQLDSEIASLKNNVTDYFNIISEIIAVKTNKDTLSAEQIITYLKYKSDIKYIAMVDDSDNTSIYPANFDSMIQFNRISDDHIIELNGQNILKTRIVPGLKYVYGFKVCYLGVLADRIIFTYQQNFKNSIIFTVLSFGLFLFSIALYILDFYKPLMKDKLKQFDIKTTDMRNEKNVPDDGILKLKSRLVNSKRELKSINNILAATIKSQRNFIKVISHDLKAPLRNVSGLVDSIFRKYSDSLEWDVTDRLSRIKNNVDKEREMISDILHNITSQKRILDYEKVDLNQIVLSIIENLDFEIQDKKIDVKIKEKLPYVYSNKIILKHVFQNLLDNACKYFPRKGKNRIEISYTETTSEHIFAVQDTGPGITKEVQKSLFHLPEFGQSLKENDETDSGLGLELVSTFIEIINGKIWLKSEIGEGSTFFISLNKLDDTKAGIFE